MLIPYLSRELYEAGPAPGMHGPSWGIVGRNMYFYTVMYRSLSLDYQYQSTTFTNIMLKSAYYSRIKGSMLFGTYYAQNYASIIRPGLLLSLFTAHISVAALARATYQYHVTGMDTDVSRSYYQSSNPIGQHFIHKVYGHM